VDIALEQLFNPQFRLARPSLLRWQVKGNEWSCSGLAGQMRMPGPGYGSGQARARPRAACGSAGRLEPPVYGCHSGYQDAAEDLGDHEHGEDHGPHAPSMY